jgi:hypothetical protein
MNEDFRQAVTQTAFCLLLTKHQVATLVYLNELLERELSLGFGTMDRQHRFEVTSDWGLSASRRLVGSARGLQDRGLLTHRSPTSPRAMYRPASEYYSITAAGELVVGLLREAGIYTEVASSIRFDLLVPGEGLVAG